MGQNFPRWHFCPHLTLQFDHPHGRLWKKKKRKTLCCVFPMVLGPISVRIRLIFHEAISWDFRRQNFYQNAIGISGNG